MDILKTIGKFKPLKTFEEYFIQEKNFCLPTVKDFPYLFPKKEEIKKETIKEFLKKEKLVLLIPLKEQRDTIKFLLNYAQKRLPFSSILVVDDGSSEKVKKSILKFKKVILINKEEILKMINWEKLLPILNLKKIPQGKGTTVMAGCLFLYLLRGKEDFWLFQTDADIENPENFKPLEYLSYGILNYPNALQIKIAQGGRNNEANMAVRSSLIILEDIDKVIFGQDAKILAWRARDLFEKLTKYKWILGGTFALPSKVVFERPFATGYLEEMLICTFVEDLAQKEKKPTVQVENPNFCRDSPNDFKKENITVQMTANFVMTLLLMKKPINEWTLEDISWINHNLLSREKPIALIPQKETHEKVIIENLDQEKIIPSIKMMIEGGLI
jgi:hypothetical protein